MNLWRRFDFLGEYPGCICSVSIVFYRCGGCMLDATVIDDVFSIAFVSFMITIDVNTPISVFC